MAKWMVYSYDAMYGGLHGMNTIDFVEGEEEDAVEVGLISSQEVVESYSCITDTLREDACEGLEEDDPEIEERYAELLIEDAQFDIVRLRDDVDLYELDRMDLDYHSYVERFKATN